MARELNIPVALLCQLRRPAEGKKHAPTMNELKDTGSLEEDSDIILCLWRPEQEDNLHEVSFKGSKTPTDGRIFIYNRKYRNGEIFKECDYFDGPTMTLGRTRA